MIKTRGVLSDETKQAKEKASLDIFEETLARVTQDVFKEVNRQLEKWGIQHHNYPAWRAIFDEELAEVACSVIAGKNSGYDELIHTVAVGFGWLTDIRTRG